MHWLKEEEEYLRGLCANCTRLANVYKGVYAKYKRMQTRLRMPAIIVGSLTGIASFGTSTFPTAAQSYVSIVVGVISVGIAILNTVESFFKVSETTSAASATIVALERLQDDVLKELALPIQDRTTNGITFLRDVYVRYQQILNQAPVSHIVHSLQSMATAQVGRATATEEVVPDSIKDALKVMLGIGQSQAQPDVEALDMQQPVANLNPASRLASAAKNILGLLPITQQRAPAQAVSPQQSLDTPSLGDLIESIRSVQPPQAALSRLESAASSAATTAVPDPTDATQAALQKLGASFKTAEQTVHSTDQLARQLSALFESQKALASPLNTPTQPSPEQLILANELGVNVKDVAQAVAELQNDALQIVLDRDLKDASQ